MRKYGTSEKIERAVEAEPKAELVSGELPKFASKVSEEDVKRFVETLNRVKRD